MFTLSQVDTKIWVSFFPQAEGGCLCCSSPAPVLEFSSFSSTSRQILQIRTQQTWHTSVKFQERGTDGFLQRKRNCERGDWSRRLFFQIISCLGLGRRLLMSTCLVLTNARGFGPLIVCCHKALWWLGFTMGRGDFLSPAHT